MSGLGVRRFPAKVYRNSNQNQDQETAVLVADVVVVVEKRAASPAERDPSGRQVMSVGAGQQWKTRNYPAASAIDETCWLIDGDGRRFELLTVDHPVGSGGWILLTPRERK